MSAPAFIGVDAGASVIKAAAFGSDGRQFGGAERVGDRRALLKSAYLVAGALAGDARAFSRMGGAGRPCRRSAARAAGAST